MNKTIILEKSFSVVSDRIASIRDAIQDAESALTDETKSSAGDKYEVSREMLQQDLGRLESQLQIARNDWEILERIQHTSQPSSSLGLGSVVHTDDGLCYFIAIGIGKIQAGSDNCYVISLASPLGKALYGKQENDYFEINCIKKKVVRVI